MIALIPARGNSKGVPRKNIRLFDGKPLVRWTVDAAKESRIFQKIYVSSDSDEILNLCQDVTLARRNPRLACDDTTMDQVVEDFLKVYPCDEIMLLQPTSPLRTAQHIQEAVSVYYQGNPLVSMCKTDNKYLTGYVNNNPIFPHMNRQQRPDFYVPNGAIYLFTRDDFYKENNIPRHNVDIYPMEESLDVDTEEDFDGHCVNPINEVIHEISPHDQVSRP